MATAEIVTSDSVVAVVTRGSQVSSASFNWFDIIFWSLIGISIGYLVIKKWRKKRLSQFGQRPYSQ